MIFLDTEMLVRKRNLRNRHDFDCRAERLGSQVLDDTPKLLL